MIGEPTSDTMKLILAFAENRGLDMRNKYVRDAFVFRHRAAAVELLGMSDGKYETARKAMDEIAAFLDREAEKNGFTWRHLSAIPPYFGEWLREENHQNENKARKQRT